MKRTFLILWQVRGEQAFHKWTTKETLLVPAIVQWSNLHKITSQCCSVFITYAGDEEIKSVTRLIKMMESI